MFSDKKQDLSDNFSYEAQVFPSTLDVIRTATFNAGDKVTVAVLTSGYQYRNGDSKFDILLLKSNII